MPRRAVVGNMRFCRWSPDGSDGGRRGDKASMDYAPYKDALLRKRGEILSTGGGVKPLPATIEVNSRQGDLADQASGNNEVHIQLKLKQTDAKILQAIEEALYRMEKGTYGICRDCGEEIAPARLMPFPGRASALPAKKNRARESHRTASAPARLLSGQADDKAAARGRGEARARLRFQQYLPVHHCEGGRAAELAARCDHRPGWRRSTMYRSRRFKAPGRDRGSSPARSARIAMRPSASSTPGGRGSRRCRNARHRSLLRVILGETLEHKRFFDQAVAGRSDLLGRRADGAGTGGVSCAVRWIERSCSMLNVQCPMSRTH